MKNKRYYCNSALKTIHVNHARYNDISLYFYVADEEAGYRQLGFGNRGNLINFYENKCFIL